MWVVLANWVNQFFPVQMLVLKDRAQQNVLLFAHVKNSLVFWTVFVFEWRCSRSWAWMVCSLLLGVSKDFHSLLKLNFVNHAIQQFINSESSCTRFKMQLWHALHCRLCLMWQEKSLKTLDPQCVSWTRWPIGHFITWSTMYKVGRSPNWQNTFIFRLTTVVTNVCRKHTAHCSIRRLHACMHYKCVLSTETLSLSMCDKISAFPPPLGTVSKQNWMVWEWG